MFQVKPVASRDQHVSFPDSTKRRITRGFRILSPTRSVESKVSFEIFSIFAIFLIRKITHPEKMIIIFFEMMYFLIREMTSSRKIEGSCFGKSHSKEGIQQPRRTDPFPGKTVTPDTVPTAAQG